MCMAQQSHNIARVNRVGSGTNDMNVARMRQYVSTVEVAVGWLRLVGSLKLQVSLAKEPYKRDDILQKRLIILRSLLHVATP